MTESVNWELIQTPLPDILRVALSIKAGKIAASTILRKLGTNSSQNKLYRAFHELGRAIRTGFLLQYIHDADLRATIHAATNKGEAFNGFAKWLSFGGEGVIATNNREEQLQELTHSGYSIETATVAALSPYWTHHVNRFGIYDLNLDRCPPTLDFDTAIIPAPTN